MLVVLLCVCSLIKSTCMQGFGLWIVRRTMKSNPLYNQLGGITTFNYNHSHQIIIQDVASVSAIDQCYKLKTTNASCREWCLSQLQVGICASWLMKTAQVQVQDESYQHQHMLEQDAIITGNLVAFTVEGIVQIVTGALHHWRSIGGSRGLATWLK